MLLSRAEVMTCAGLYEIGEKASLIISVCNIFPHRLGTPPRPTLTILIVIKEPCLLPLIRIGGNWSQEDSFLGFICHNGELNKDNCRTSRRILGCQTAL